MVERSGISLAGAEQDSEPAEVGEVRHGFQLGPHRLMLRAGTFSELSSKTHICVLPDTPAWFSGFINHRGHTVPVYDLSLLLGQGATDLSRQYWILLVDRQPSTLGIILRQIPVALRDPEPISNDHDDPLPEPLASCQTSQYRVQQQCWGELDHHALIRYLKRHFREAAKPVAHNSNKNNELS
ncbi:chemotaxis protein CheW [Marinobacterium sp. D7]|uniref:chemotaxis protein CheW n=1 Tax=Marinobacterium ramblicola TaxID=2849041 RepID=UPI001C2D75B3|nr:chemotaxis protein CheW [Marinobacterium ramblicola]MBV1788975.1 chemotaxis protein CheW [Marinobacterium ramblicola]